MNNGNGDRRAEEMDARIVEKIKATAAPAELYHVAGRVMGHELAEVDGDDGTGIVITSDGMAQIGGNVFLGPADGLRRALATLIELAKLDQAEAARFWDRYAATVADWRGRGK